MWELDHKEGWALKNCCLQTVVLKKTLESPLNCKEIQSVHPKGNQPWIFTGRTDAEVEVPKLWPPDEKIQLTGNNSDAGKDGRPEEKDEGEMAGWHQWLGGQESERTPGDGERQGSLEPCSPWGRKEFDMTQPLIDKELYSTKKKQLLYTSSLDCVQTFP